MLTILHEQKKDQNAAYYLAVLEKDNPNKMIELFLAAEKQRDLAKEQKEFEKSSNQTKLTKVKSGEAIAITTAIAMDTSDGRTHAVNALLALNNQGHTNTGHALSEYFYHQAMVFLPQQVSLLQKAVHFAEQDLEKLALKDCTHYPEILHALGIAIRDQATSTFNAKKIGITELKSQLEQAEEKFKHASNRGYSLSTTNMAAIQKEQFALLKARNKLDIAITSYVQALQENAPGAQNHVENLLLCGIEGMPLNLVQRKTLFDALKKSSVDSELLAVKEFRESIYYQKALLENIPGNLEFYEGLYWYDRGDSVRAGELILRVGGKHTAANSFAINMEIHHANPEIALRAIKNYWNNNTKRDFSENVIINGSIKEVMAQLAAQNNLPAIYMSIYGCLTFNFSPEKNSIEAVCDWLDKGEKIISNNEHPHLRHKISEDEFLLNLLSFAKKNQSSVPLYKTISIAIDRLQNKPLISEAHALKRILVTLALVLNRDLKKPMREYVPCPESGLALRQKIDLITAHSEEQWYFKNLRCLQLILDGKPQSEENIDSQKDKDLYSDKNMNANLEKQFAKQSFMAAAAMQHQQDREIIDCLRYTIKLFQAQNMPQLYAALRSKHHIFSDLEQYVTKKQIRKPEDEVFLLNQKLLIIADQAFADSHYQLDVALQKFCKMYPILGTALVARELINDVLFKKDTIKAQKYLQQAKAEAASAGLEISAILIKETESAINKA